MIDHTLSLQQEEFFSKSVVRDKDGLLLPVYHGTGTNIEAFDPAFTGQGNDQYGSGFYFTDNWDTAYGYATACLKANDGTTLPKPGGKDRPHVIEAYLDIHNPIYVDGKQYSNLRHIEITGPDVFQIFKRMPALYFSIYDDDCPNPLGDYFPEVWENPPTSVRQFNRYILRLAMEYFNSTDLFQLDCFFKEFPTEFREALHEVFGYDGVVVRFETSSHYVAWFPEQIKSIDNLFPTRSKYMAY